MKSVGERYSRFFFYFFTVAMLIGYKSKISTFVVGVLVMFIYRYFWLMLGEVQVSSHMYLIGMAALLCALTPCDESYSLDRWLAVRRAWQSGHTPPPEQGNLWGLRLIVVQLTMMYFWSAINKIQPDFASGDRLEHIQAFPIPGGIPKSRKQCESSVVGGDGGRPWRELTARICVIV